MLAMVACRHAAAVEEADTAAAGGVVAGSFDATQNTPAEKQ
jgi:hypothetical protein